MTGFRQLLLHLLPVNLHLQDLTGKAVGIILAKGAFAALNLEHSIANMYLVGGRRAPMLWFVRLEPARPSLLGNATLQKHFHAQSAWSKMWQYTNGAAPVPLPCILSPAENAWKGCRFIRELCPDLLLKVPWPGWWFVHRAAAAV